MDGVVLMASGCPAPGSAQRRHGPGGSWAVAAASAAQTQPGPMKWRDTERQSLHPSDAQGKEPQAHESSRSLEAGLRFKESDEGKGLKKVGFS